MKSDANPEKPILIVDDEEQYLASVSITLRMAGFDNVTLCSDSRSVKDILQQDSFSLALLDMNMPHRTGLEVLDDIRTVQPDLPVIIVTASMRLDSAAQSAVKGVFDYLVKPVDRNNLLASIRRALYVKSSTDTKLVKDILLSDQFDRSNEPGSREDGLWFLETARREYRVLFNRLPVPYFIMGMENHQVKYANQAFYAFFGIGDCDVPFLSFLDQPDRAALEAELQTNRHINGRTLCGRASTGERFAIVASFQFSETEGYIHGSFIDVTARRALEEELALSRRMEALGRMAGGVAHDFSNVLHLINGYASLLNDDPELPRDIRHSVEEIMRASRKGTDIAWQLLSIAKKKKAAPIRVDLHAVVRDIKPMLQSMLGGSITLDCRLYAANPIVEAEPGQLEQILLNLVLNARDSMPKGGSVALSTASLAGGTEPNEGFILEVRDTGMGMKPSVKERIFEPFFTTKAEGTGLGLATVYANVKACGGRIEVESEVNAGSTFRVIFYRK